MLNEITIFRPGSTKKEVTISATVPVHTVNVLSERFGKEAAKKARAAFKFMKENDTEFMQFRHEGRKFRIRQDVPVEG